MALWNQKHLPAPPTNTYRSKTQDLDIVKLKNALQDCMRHFKNDDLLVRETALLSRILYRMKMKFRSSKEFKSLEKINHSLNIYLNTNMTRDLNNISNSIPSKYKMETYLPTRNMLNYILVRIQGLVKLMERVYDTCQVAASEINIKISIGHFWKNYVILFALVSRIYVLVKFNTKLLCELYGKLLPHSNRLENTGRNWLPEGYKLPSDLREWLGVDWVYEEEFIDLTEDLTLNASVKILDFFNLVDDDDDDEVQFCNEYVLIDEEDKNIERDFGKLTPIKETLTRNRMRGFSINEDDIGEDIAEIIKLNETNMENLVENNKDNSEKESPLSPSLSHKHAEFDVNDIGEEISSIEYNVNDKIQIINLDETNKFSLNRDKTIKCSEINNGLIKSPKKDMSKSTKNNKSTKRNTNNTIINLADDTMVMEETDVIIIPDTPLKINGHKLQDDSVIALDDTFSETSILSKTKNTLEELIKNGKQKRKSKNKRDTGLDSNNMHHNVSTSLISINVDSSLSSACLGGSGTSTKETQETSVKERTNDNNDGKSIHKPEMCEEISEHQQISPNINNISSSSTQDIINKTETKEQTLEKLDKRESEESNNLPLGSTTTKEITTEESLTRPLNNSNTQQNKKITENGVCGLSKSQRRRRRRQSRGANSSVTLHIEQEKLIQAENTKRKKEKKMQRALEEERGRKELMRYNSILEEKLIHGEPQPEFKKKNKNNPEREREKEKEKSSIDNKKPTNVVRLTFLNEIPKRENINQEKHKDVANSCKDKSTKKIKLVPCLETPIKATLNVNALLEATTRGDTFIKQAHDISLNRSKNFNVTMEKTGEFKQLLRNKTPEMTGKKELQEVNSKKQALNTSVSETSTTNITREANKSKDPKEPSSNISLERMEHTKKRRRRFKGSDMGEYPAEKSKKSRFEVSRTSVETTKSKNIESNKKDDKEGTCFIDKPLNKVSLKEFLFNMSLEKSAKKKSNVWKEEKLDRSLLEISTETWQNKEEKREAKKKKRKKRKLDESGNILIDLLKNKESKKKL